jgi:cytochrome c biogenesis protein CcmG/thiol:disulfide interchange protein DsbE
VGTAVEDPKESAQGELASVPRRIKIVRITAFLIIPGLFVGFLTFGVMKRTSSQRLVGKSAPQFTLPTLSDGVLSSDDLKGRPLVVNFWASWCLPCREEAPTFRAKYEKYKGQQVQFLGVNVQDSKEDARAFVDEFDLTFPSVRDTNLKLHNSFGVRGLPETFFIDHTYTFRAIGSGKEDTQQAGFKILGAIEPALLESQIRYLLALKRDEGS